MLPASGWQVLVKDNWGENMFYAIQSTGNASIALFALVEVLLASILFTNLFVGVICSVLCRDVGVDNASARDCCCGGVPATAGLSRV